MSRLPKRIIILDTELTGTEPNDGDRVLSLGLVELFDGVRFGQEREWFFNPEGKMIPQYAIDIHGLTNERMAVEKPFQHYVSEIVEFIKDDPIAHHCWVFRDSPLSVDEKFMQIEFLRAGQAEIPHERWVNMKEWAKRIDSQNNSLNAMLDRFGIDRTARNQHHGALIDARLASELFVKIAPQFFV